MEDTRAGAPPSSRPSDVPEPRQLHAVGHGHATPVQYTCSDGIGVVTLASPQSRNALSPEVLEGLDAACNVAVEEGAKVLVLTGAGRTFCAGGDLGGVNDALHGGGDAEAEIAVMVDRLHRVMRVVNRNFDGGQHLQGGIVGRGGAGQLQVSEPGGAVEPAPTSGPLA